MTDLSKSRMAHGAPCNRCGFVRCECHHLNNIDRENLDRVYYTYDDDPAPDYAPFWWAVCFFACAGVGWGIGAIFAALVF